MYAIRNLFTALVLVTAAIGCAASAPSDDIGTLELPLTTNVGAEIYRLSPATFEITGPGGTLVLDGSSDVASVSTELPPGITTVLLRSGWTLTRSDDGGATFLPVSAVLGSSNPLAVRILADTASLLSFEFLVRNPNGNLSVHFGVDPTPRQLAGGISVTAGTGELAGSVGQRFDFSTYFRLFSTARRVEADGAKTTIFSVGANATEYFNDTAGVFHTVIAPSLVGGFLEYRVTAKLDGTFELAGEHFGNTSPFTTIIIGPAPLALASVDADGFPADAFFVGSVPYTLEMFHNGVTSTASGRLVVRHLVP